MTIFFLFMLACTAVVVEIFAREITKPPTADEIANDRRNGFLDDAWAP
jgi:hypothetical protein